MISTRWIRSLSFWIEDCELTAKLIELQLCAFDIILAMDFLSKYGATIYCKQKMLVFEPDSADLAGFGVRQKDVIMVDSTKIDFVRDWPTPKSATKVKSFLGLAGYYCQFVEGFLKIATPLAELTRKNLKFTRIDRCEKSLQELKQWLITTPILTLPSDKEKFCCIL
uniref:Uncharacterized protein n=1 Tax=Cannabis sativa TaxID=3483 RepID=A0A803Q2Y9_CANSA